MSRTEARVAKVVEGEGMAKVVEGEGIAGVIYEEGRTAASDPELSELLGSLAHELRNPLASLQGCAQTLAERGDELPADVRRRMADVISRHAQRMDWLIRAVGSFASPGVPGDDDVDLVDLLREVGASCGLEVEVDGGFAVLGNAGRLRLALEALLTAFGPATDVRLATSDRRVEMFAPEIDPASSGRRWKVEVATRMLAIDGGRLEVGRDERGAVARLTFVAPEKGGGR